MKTLPLIILLFSLPFSLKAEGAHLTKEQVKEIAVLVSKGVAPGEPHYDSKKGTWTCFAGVAAPDSGLIIEIRDMDAYYRTSENYGLIKDFKMATSLKKRIAKILKSKGEHVVGGNGG